MALTSEDRLILIRIKIERAKKHFRDLCHEISAAGYATEPIAINHDKSSVRQIYRPNPNDEIIECPRLPFDALATAGDVIHNLRSALDHLAHQLVVVHSRVEPSKRVEFPIAKDFATYEATKAEKVDGMGPEAKEAIDRLKPYGGGNDSLWRLHELDNIDKHRTLLTIGRNYLLFAHWCPGDYLLRTSIPHFSGAFPDPMERETQLEIEKAITQSLAARGDSLLPSLHELVKVIEDLILGFEPLLQ